MMGKILYDRSYQPPRESNHSGDEKTILRRFYRSLSKLYHPDRNPGVDTGEEMQLLNRLKEQWGV